MNEGNLSEVPKFPAEFVSAGDASAIPCLSKMSPTGTHFYAQIEFRGEMRSMCRFCGAREMIDIPLVRAIDPNTPVIELAPNLGAVGKPTLEEFRKSLREAIPKPENGREAFEQNVSRKQAESVATDLTGRDCWTGKRRIGKRKTCVLYVGQGDGKKALMFEGSDWWITLRGLFSFLKNRGQLPGPDEGGEVVPA